MSKHYTKKQLDILSRPSGWLYAMSLEPEQYYPTQALWMDGRPEKILELTEKSRRVGYTYAKATGAVARAHIHKGSTTIFTSMNLQESFDKIEVARAAYFNLHPEIRKPLVTDTKMMLEFAHDAKAVSRIICMFLPRGQKGRKIFVNIDEFNYIQKQEEVLTAAMANATHGGYISIGGSVHGGTRFFSELWNRSFKEDVDPEIERIMKEAMIRIRVPWWCCPFLVADVWRKQAKVVHERAPGMSTVERVKTFASKRLKMIYANSYEDHFQQEYELVPIADGSSVIPWDTICDCTPTGDRMEIPQDLAPLRRGKLASFGEAARLAERLGGRLWLGYDVGRHRNASELTVDLELPRDGVLYEAFYQTSEKTPFDTQKAVLRSYLSMSPQAILAIDATQMGGNVAEDLKREFRRRVVEVVFQNYNKLEMFDLLLARMQRRALILCADKARMDQLFALKRKTSEAGNTIYYVPRKETHHADKAVSIALAAYARDGAGVRVGRSRVTSSRRKGVTLASRPQELTPDRRSFHDDLAALAG